VTGGPAVHLGTFDAERWWRPPDLAELPRAPRAGGAVEGMDELLAGFCDPGDLLVTRGPMADELRAGLDRCGLRFAHHHLADPGGGDAEPVEALARRDPSTLDLLRAYPVMSPYAVLPDTALLAGRLGAADRLPSAAAVARVNSKSWSNALAGRLGLPGAGRLVRSVDELASAVTWTGFEAVVKDPYGVSGRATLEVRTPGVLRAVTRTLGRQEAAGRRVELVVQPRYARRADFSGHLRIDPDGNWEPLGVQVMTNRGFRFIGSRAADRPFVELLDRDGYFEVLGEVAKALAGDGYWGPVGVDSLVAADGTVVPILEVNARRSLGLLALRLDRRVRDDGLRCHLWQVELSVPPGGDADALIAALRRDGASYAGGARPGVLVLAGSRLAAPGGRVHCALLCRPGEVAATQARMLASAASAGMTPRGVVDAA
jgi:hypothetical protein